MRIWDIAPEKLCRSHLLGEHTELHAIWSILARGKKGYAHHPETMRWKGRLKALYNRHEMLVQEIEQRGYKHQSLLEFALATGKEHQDTYVNTVEEQIAILRDKNCGCNV